MFAAIARLWAATGVANPARGDTFAAVAATLRHGARLFTVRVGRRIAGVCWLTNDGRRLYLHHMAVAPADQGRGYGALLLDAALAYARASCLQIKLEVHRDNHAARRLYLRHGFTSLGDYDVLILRETGAG